MSLRGITKKYGFTEVLDGIDLEVRAGRCLGLVGENGAGKSTLVGVMSGRIPETAGDLRLNGELASFRSPRSARAKGIVLIPQELAYVPDLSVAENLMLSNWPAGRWSVSQRWLSRTSEAALVDVGLYIDVRRRLNQLSLAERQLVEIAKALLSNARLLILDEPTAALHAGEADFLLNVLHQLKSDGVALVFVSHHLDEAFEISDDIVVLRNGHLEDNSPTSQTTLERTISLMLGPDYVPSASQQGVVPDDGEEAAIALSDWNCVTQPILADCSFSVRQGEVLGVFGLVGSGAETVARGLGGHQRGITGSVNVGGKSYPVPRSVRNALRHGIAYMPADRKTEGLVLNQSIVENLTVMILDKFRVLRWLLRRREQIVAAESAAIKVDVRCRSVQQEVGQLSGGNQQKVLLASRLEANPRILVLHEPTRGVDIGSRSQIHRQLVEFARGGAAVVLVTSDVEEAVEATDRLVVLRDGSVVDELVGDRKTKAVALLVASGDTNGR